MNALFSFSSVLKAKYANTHKHRNKAGRAQRRAQLWAELSVGSVEKELELGVQASAGEYNAFPGESVSSGALIIVDRRHRMGG
jgi:hypothetical protein